MEVDHGLLASIASGGLGKWEKDRSGRSYYRKHEDCMGCLRDLQRMLREDDPEERPVFLEAAKYNFTRNDLVPLLTTYPDDQALVVQTLKVCTLLSMPPEQDRAVSELAAGVRATSAVCEAFTVPDALGVVIGLLEAPLSAGRRIQEEGIALIQLVLTFLRNLLATQVDCGGSEAGLRTRLHFVRRCFEEGVVDILLLAVHNAQERSFRNEGPLLVEIMLGLLGMVDPAVLLQAQTCGEQNVTGKKNKDTKRGVQTNTQATGTIAQQAKPSAVLSHLPRLDRATAAMRALAMRAPTRHAHTGAVFVRRHLDHGRDVVLRNNPRRQELPARSGAADAKQAQAHRRDGSLATTVSLSFTVDPVACGLLVDLMEAFVGEEDDNIQENDVRQTQNQFARGGYNALMPAVFSQLRAGLLVSTLSRQDFFNFTRLAGVCTKFVRLREEERLKKLHASQKETDVSSSSLSPFAGIAATMAYENFHWVHMLWLTTSDVSERHGKQTNHTGKVWDLQHASVPLFKEMLLVLDLARTAGSRHDAHVADRLQRKLLHDDQKDSGLLPVLSRLIRGYNYRFQPRSHALDLVETLHIVLTMLDRLASPVDPHRLRVVHEKKVRHISTPKREAQNTEGPSQVVDEGEKAEAAAEQKLTSDDENDDSAVEKNGTKLTSGVADDGLSQSSDVPSGRNDNAESPEQKLDLKHNKQSDDNEQAAPNRATQEIMFDLQRRVRQECAHPAMVHFYTWLLSGYKINSPFSMHAIVCFLERVCDPSGLNLEPMLYQISMLRVFYEILSDHSVRSVPTMRPALRLATGVTRNLMARLLGSSEQKEANEVESDDLEVDSDVQKASAAEKEVRASCRSMLFVELLFWKSAAVAEDVRDEYNWKKLLYPSAVPSGARHRRKALAEEDEDDDDHGDGPKRMQGAFTDQQADQLQHLFEKCNGGKDCLQRLVEALGGAFTKTAISRQLRLMGLKRGQFTKTQDSRLRELYAEYKEQLADLPARERQSSTIALATERLDAGFTERQVKKRLQELALLPGGRKGNDKSLSGRDWNALLGDDDDSDDESQERGMESAGRAAALDDDEDEGREAEQVNGSDQSDSDSDIISTDVHPRNESGEEGTPSVEALNDSLDAANSNRSTSIQELEMIDQHASVQAAEEPSKSLENQGHQQQVDLAIHHILGKEETHQSKEATKKKKRQRVSETLNEEEDERQGAQRRLEALELLRKRHQHSDDNNVQAGNQQEDHITERGGEQSQKHKEPSSEPSAFFSQEKGAKTFGRRLKKRAPASAEVHFALPTDLED